MSTVFLSGSRKITRLNDAIRARLKNMVDNGLSIIIGDANGADKAMQCYLSEITYRNVTVYCAGDHCRNNVGKWSSQMIEVDPKLTGRDFYAKKDQAMAALADFGFVLWDGKSAGSIGNVFELLKRGKKVVLYYAPDREFHTIGDERALSTLLVKCDPETLGTIRKKTRFGSAASGPLLTTMMLFDS